MSLSTNLQTSLNEKDVENYYRHELLKIFEESQITSPYGCDGVLKFDNVRTLLEFKYKQMLKNKLSQCNVLIQCLYYLKKFENSGEVLPSTIFVGDQNECFAIHTNSIVKYLSEEIDWKIAPSEAHKLNPELIKAMVNDINILPFVFDVDEHFKIKQVIDKIRDLSDNIIRKLRITHLNAVAIYDYFDKNVLDNNPKLNVNEKANLFIQIIINPDENYIHPKKKNLLVTKSFGDVHINQNLFVSFFSHFEGDVYSPKEKEALTGLVDRLIEDTTRRKKGEFFTPTAFVNLAHKYISDAFGEDWKEKYIVWDCAWGTGNLTRDYKFKELYASTLEQSDIDTANQMNYNPEAIKFKFDFLNDDDSKLPSGLLDAIQCGKQILFFINPPYATASNKDLIKEENKADIQKTAINKLMLANKMGYSAKNLYAQFLYKILQFKKINNNMNICIFCPPLFLTGQDFLLFRNLFSEKFGFKSGFLFEASHFSDVATGWGIAFTIFNSNNNKNYILDIIECNEAFELEKTGEKILYNTDNEVASNKWIRTEIKKLEKIEFPMASSALSIKEKGYGSVVNNFLADFVNNGNSPYNNQTNVILLSAPFTGKNGISVIKENFIKTTALFFARKSVIPMWMNCKDEYLAPNESHKDYEQYTYDSIIYSLFNNSSQQSSLRQVEYKGKLWDIKNEFFWLSKNKMQKLANENNYDTIYSDAKQSESERFVYTKLFLEERIYDKLSEDARKVLDMATELLEKSIAIRKIVSAEHPEYHLDSFDAGYAQLKLVWKEYFKEDFKAFRESYKALEDRMRPLVYELGFLRK